MSGLIPFEERMMETILARLRTISVANFPGSDSIPYQTEVSTVVRGIINLEGEYDDYPSLSVSPAAVVHSQRPGKNHRNDFTVSIAGVTMEEDLDMPAASSAVSTNMMRLWSDVTRALLVEPLHGATYPRCIETNFDEGIAYPRAWFGLTFTVTLDYNAANAVT